MMLANIDDVALVTSTGFAAAAAIASWIAIRQTRRDFLATLQPDLEITVIENLDTGEIKIHLQNHGRAPARNVKFVVVQGQDATYGFLPPNATLAPGEGTMLSTPMRSQSDQPSIAVAICNDARGYVHAWKVDGQHKKWKLSRPWNRSLSDQKVFNSFYAGIDPFALNLVRHEVVD
jgi:hypothetical protein